MVVDPLLFVLMQSLYNNKMTYTTNCSPWYVFQCYEMKRPCIEVKDTSSILRDNDPISHFVYMLNDQHKQNDVLEDNITLLKTLITNGHIAKSSIIIDNDHIMQDIRAQYRRRRPHHIRTITPIARQGHEGWHQAQLVRPVVTQAL